MISVVTRQPDALKQALNESGWLSEEVVAAGQLRQGKAPTMLGMISGAALIEVLRPRRSKLLPRHFVLAVTPSRVVAFKATGGSGDSSSVYKVNIREAEAASFPRSSVTMTDVPEGERSKGGIMSIDGEQFPVARPNLNGDPSTDELIALLAGIDTSPREAGEAPSGGGLIT